MLWYIHSITKEMSITLDADSVIRDIACLNMFNHSTYSATLIRREVGTLARNYTRLIEDRNNTNGAENQKNSVEFVGDHTVKVEM